MEIRSLQPSPNNKEPNRLQLNDWYGDEIPVKKKNTL
jgi:hypothetical protein